MFLYLTFGNPDRTVYYLSLLVSFNELTCLDGIFPQPVSGPSTLPEKACDLPEALCKAWLKLHYKIKTMVQFSESVETFKAMTALSYHSFWTTRCTSIL